jgi:PIN domain nuclease of toxin-antitoxin system
LPPAPTSRCAGPVLDSTTNFDVMSITVDTMEYFDRVPLAKLADSFDRLILATAAQLQFSLVTADRAMSKAGVVPVIR